MAQNHVNMITKMHSRAIRDLKTLQGEGNQEAGHHYLAVGEDRVVDLVDRWLRS